uniref:Capsular exopolysaccharide biosynthesis protein n=1 Tax=Desulfovibrio sp. U5L TaxID=596152 RepID=I2Q341_9BACT
MSRIEEALGKAAERQAGMPRPEARLFFRQDAPLPQPSQAIDPARLSEEKLVVLKSPASPEAEEFRKLKEALVKAIRDPDGFNNVILVTSAHHGEGKSLLVVNLAISLAQEFDHTVLVVDADLRAPTCHRYLEVAPERGLSDCLLEGLDVGPALINTGIGKLVLLPAGKAVKNPMELLSSNSMRRLMTEIKQRYRDRIILVDTPPVLLFAETRSLADVADGAVLVVREGKTSLEDVQESLTLLNNKVLGLVYNATDYVKPCSSYYSSYYAACND